MHPLAEAEAWHKERSTEPFHTVHIPHIRLGYVLLTPDSLLLARRVSSTWSEDDLRTPSLIDPAGDAIFIWLQIGKPILSYRSLIPPGIRFLIYHRGPRLILRRIPSSYFLPLNSQLSTINSSPPRFHTAE